MTRRPITLAELQDGLITAAWAVEQYGEVFLPIYERMEKEVMAAQSQQDSRSRAQAIAGSFNSSKNVQQNVQQNVQRLLPTGY